MAGAVLALVGQAFAADCARRNTLGGGFFESATLAEVVAYLEAGF